MDQRIFGYARVSSANQNLDRQLIELERYVPRENIVVDKESGKDLQRSGYQALKGPLGLRKNDILYIKSLDRLSRNKQDIKNELEWFKAQGVRLIVLDLPTTQIQIPDGQEWILEMVNNILIEVLGSIAEQERLTIKKRQREGIEAARMKGRHLGRPRIPMPENFDDTYRLWREKRITARKAMEILHVSSSTFYRLVRVYESENVSKSQ